MLDVQMLQAMPPGTKFAVIRGSAYTYVAVRGGIADWAVYEGLANSMGVDEIASNGDKLCSEKLIRQLVPCDDESFGRYRF